MGLAPCHFCSLSAPLQAQGPPFPLCSSSCLSPQALLPHASACLSLPQPLPRFPPLFLFSMPAGPTPVLACGTEHSPSPAPVAAMSCMPLLQAGLSAPGYSMHGACRHGAKVRGRGRWGGRGCRGEMEVEEGKAAALALTLTLSRGWSLPSPFPCILIGNSKMRGFPPN